jgi:inner membrane protein
MALQMPSPFGHALAGLTIAMAADAPGARPRRWWAPGLSDLALMAIFCAVIPDLDLVYPPWHRAWTHSVGATALVMIIAAAVTGKVTGKIDWRWVWALGAAHASHLLLDWLGTDRLPPIGIELFWPFNDGFYLSGLNWFPPVERRLTRDAALVVNARAFVYEAVVLGVITAATWALTRSRRNQA